MEVNSKSEDEYLDDNLSEVLSSCHFLQDETRELSGKGNVHSQKWEDELEYMGASLFQEIITEVSTSRQELYKVEYNFIGVLLEKIILHLNF
jgi:hypothetical protein